MTGQDEVPGAAEAIAAVTELAGRVALSEGLLAEVGAYVVQRTEYPGPDGSSFIRLTVSLTPEQVGLFERVVGHPLQPRPGSL